MKVGLWAALVGMGISFAAVRVLAQGTTAIAHVAVVDVRLGVVRGDRTVIVRGNRIVIIGAAGTTAIPAGAHVMDGRGKFLVPGYWDMHVHTVVPGGREVLPLYVANGVTGVRDMASDFAQITAMRRDVAQGTLVGPRIVASGPYIEGGDVPIAHFLVRNAAEATAAVDTLKRMGVDFIKIHSQLTRETYFASARAARAAGMVFAGHVPRAVGAADASDSGQKSIEHLLTIPTPCTRAESLALLPRFTVQSALGRCSSENLAPLFAKFVRNGTWVTPTFAAQVEVAGWPGRSVPGDRYAQYLPDTLRKFVEQIFPLPDSVPRGADSVGRAMLAKRFALLGTMYRAGVGVLAGTDAPLRNSPPGFGLHEEFALLARSGLTPMEVLRVTTYDAARYLGTLDSLGTIGIGKIADLVMIDGDPRRDVENLRRISAVVANGRVFEGAALKGLITRR